MAVQDISRGHLEPKGLQDVSRGGGGNGYNEVAVGVHFKLRLCCLVGLAGCSVMQKVEWQTIGSIR